MVEFQQKNEDSIRKHGNYRGKNTISELVVCWAGLTV